jgi:CRISPR-associated protein Cmr4
MFYSVVIASPSRNNGKAMNPAEVIDYLRTALFTCDGLPVIQVGGDETTGKGLCALSMTEK